MNNSNVDPRKSGPWNRGEPQNFPKISCRSHDHREGEAFFAEYAAGCLDVIGDAGLGTAYGESLMKTLAAGGHWGDFLGHSKPRYYLRPLWIGPQLQITLGRRLKSNDTAAFEKFCQRVIDLGFNAVVFDLIHIQSGLDWIGTELCKNRLKCILKLGPGAPGCPLNPKHREQVSKTVEEAIHSAPNADYLIWESGCCHTEFMNDPLAEATTRAEMLQEEMMWLEKSMKGRKPLIMYVPMDADVELSYGILLQRLCDSAGKGTIIAFSALGGLPSHDHLPQHPFWLQLRQAHQIVSTPLLPIINAGGVDQGEGLWPALSFDLFQNYFQRCTRHHFAGVISLTNRLPAPGGFLECNLWVASQLQWREIPPEVLIETWFKARRPDIDYVKERDLFKQVRDIILELSHLKFLKRRGIYTVEELRLFIESLLARLKVLKLRTSKDRMMTSNCSTATLIEQVNFFIRDARRTLLHIAQNYDVPLLSFAGEDDLQDSFWTKAVGASGQTARNGLKVMILDTPECGNAPGVMHRIYHENFAE